MSTHERSPHPLGAQSVGGGGPGQQRHGGDPAADRGGLAITYRIGSRNYEFIGGRDTVIRGFLDSVRYGYFVDLPGPAIVACLDAIESAFDSGAIPTVDAGPDAAPAAPDVAADTNPPATS